MAIYHATDASFKNDLQNEGLTLVNFWATWCGPCRMFAPIIEAYDAEGTNAAKILKANVDECPETASEFGIMSIPTTILFKNGQPADKKVGPMSQTQLKQFVENHL
ncbi:thioredoxin [Paenibacillus chitinolyticus]|uniref:thioredoxin n=1 Tax=Paenibacillus chitinolyticus TaxID=79263 RepID=UPI0026E4BF6B|nr:thioredoxin [Paenibacillus chitinolyticus]GKS15111.1 thioredoxin [Paenibacillus chitinolyticus]